MADQDEEDWIEGWGMVPFTNAELEQIKSGQKSINDVDLRNLVREILHIRHLSFLLLKQCEELGATEENNALIKLARFNLLSGPRSDDNPSQ
ncbi:MAG: hypothetical protein KA368_23000 [Acidobacteria bacterium]|nr:hypothetical protein [Acidobacteriota bacterium]